MLALVVASITAVATTEIYNFATTIKYPAIGKTAFVGSSTGVSGTLTITTIDETNTKIDELNNGDITKLSNITFMYRKRRNGTFEMYKNGSVINPEKYYDKTVKDLVNN